MANSWKLNVEANCFLLLLAFAFYLVWFGSTVGFTVGSGLEGGLTIVTSVERIP